MKDPSGENAVGRVEDGSDERQQPQPAASRPAFLTGKLIGGSMTLLVPLTLAFLVALLSAQIFGVDLLQADTLAKVGLIVVTSGAYLLCFYALGLLISSLVTSQKTSLVILLITWVVAVLAIPPLATLVAQAVSPVPPAHTIQTQKRALDDDIRREAEQAMGVVYREITGLPEGWADTRKYQEHKEVIDRRIAPIEVDYLNKRRRLMGELERDAERRTIRQNDVARVIMALSPAATFANAASDLDGTGDAHHAAWLDAARRHQSRLDTALIPKKEPASFKVSHQKRMVDRIGSAPIGRLTSSSPRMFFPKGRTSRTAGTW